VSIKETQSMAIPPRNVKSLQDIRTHAGRVEEAAIPYKAFMKMSCLEMEKFRRERERIRNSCASANAAPARWNRKYSLAPSGLGAAVARCPAICPFRERTGLVQAGPVF
jgi:hypothetical protein